MAPPPLNAVGTVSTLTQQVGRTLGQAAAELCPPVERVSGRQNYLRNLSTEEWRWLYGDRFRYSSDYIHAHTHQYNGSTRRLACAANRIEELGEIVFRFTGIWCRLAGSLRVHALREMGGRSRFCRRLHRALGSQVGSTALPDRHGCDYIFELLLSRKLITNRGALKKSSAEVKDGLIEELKAKADAGSLPTAWRNLLNSADDLQCVTDALPGALRSADLAASFTQMTLPIKVAMVSGCIMAAASYAVVYLGLSMGVSTLATTFLLKAGFLSGSIYLTAFLLRTATTLHARATLSYVGTPLLSGSSKPFDPVYRSLFDLASRRTLAFRNQIYTRAIHSTLDSGWKIEGLACEKPEKAWERERNSVLALWANEKGTVPVLAKGLAGVSMALHRATDIIFSMDRILGHGVVARPSKQWLFRYHGTEGETTLQHSQGISADGRCNYNIRYHRAADTAVGRFRRGLASLVGHGGVDSLGMAFGCAACATLWTLMNVAIPGGGMFSVALSGAHTAVIGMGFGSVCAVGWAGSVLTEGAARVAKWAFASRASEPGAQAGQDLRQGSPGLGVQPNWSQPVACNAVQANPPPNVV